MGAQGTHGRVAAILAIGIVAVATTATFTVLVTPPVSNTFATFFEAEPLAAATVVHVPGGPWTLQLVTGVELRDAYPASSWMPTNCSLREGSGRIPALGPPAGAFNANLTSGALPYWFFFYASRPNSAGEPWELLLLVSGGRTVIIGSVLASRWCGFFAAIGNDNRTAPDSSSAGLEFSTMPSVRQYLANHTSVTVLYSLWNLVGTPGWWIQFTTCSPTAASGSTGAYVLGEGYTPAEEFFGLGGFLGLAGGESTPCHCIIPMGPVNWSA